MKKLLFLKKKVLITAGPTREAIDPVRYISNHSSGKMGYAIAKAFLDQGAEVKLVSGPVNMKLEHHNLTVIHVNSAIEMFLACSQHYFETEIAIFAAAVADYRPAKIENLKIKKNEESFNLKMIKNVDLALEFGKIKNHNQLSIGFALETDDEVKHAVQKLDRKNFDMVILNSLNEKHAVFGYDTNKISIIRNDRIMKHYPLKSKKEVAEDIVHAIGQLIKRRSRKEDVSSLN